MRPSGDAMTKQVLVHSEPILDPRGEFRRKPVQLAPRVQGLKGRTIMLFDNNQLTSEQPVFGPVYKWLAQHLETQHGAHCAYGRRNLLDMTREEFVLLADEIATGGNNAVVIALCYAGITQPTSLFVAELE